MARENELLPSDNDVGIHTINDDPWRTASVPDDCDSLARARAGHVRWRDARKLTPNVGAVNAVIAKINVSVEDVHEMNVWNAKRPDDSFLGGYAKPRFVCPDEERFPRSIAEHHLQEDAFVPFFGNEEVGVPRVVGVDDVVFSQDRHAWSVHERRIQHFLERKYLDRHGFHPPCMPSPSLPWELCDRTEMPEYGSARDVEGIGGRKRHV